MAGIVNTIAAESAELPFGGVKQSGFGREMGPIGIGEFANKLGVPTPMFSATLPIYASALSVGYADQDTGAVNRTPKHP